MPCFRGYDSIGSCAKGGAVVPNSGVGHYSYDTFTIRGGNISAPDPSGEIDIAEADNPINGDWYGCAGIFDLPDDIISPETGFSMLHKNLTAYFEYTGEVTHPQLITNFNRNAAYSHSTMAVTFVPSISIDLLTGDVGASIEINVLGSTDDRITSRLIRYVPG